MRFVFDMVTSVSSSLPRVYVINKEICVRTVCQQDEILLGKSLGTSVTNYKSSHSCQFELMIFELFILLSYISLSFQLNSVERNLGGQNAKRGQLGNAVAAETQKPGQTRPKVRWITNSARKRR